MPLDSNLRGLYVQVVRNEEEFDVEGESIDMHDLEEKFCWLFIEKFEATLGVFGLNAKNHGYDSLENKGDQLPMKFSLNLAGLLLNSTRTNNYLERIFVGDL